MTIGLPAKTAWMQEFIGRTSDDEIIMSGGEMLDGGGLALIGHDTDDELDASSSHVWVPTDTLDIDVVARDFRKQGLSVLTLKGKEDIVRMMESDTAVVVSARNGRSRTVNALLVYDRAVTVTEAAVELNLAIHCLKNAAEYFQTAPLLTIFNAQCLIDARACDKFALEARLPVSFRLSFGSLVDSYDRDFFARAITIVEHWRQGEKVDVRLSDAASHEAKGATL